MSRPSPSDASITEGSLVRPLFTLAWPIVVQQLLQVAYNIADTLWLGRLSADAVGALGLAFPIVFLVLSVGGGFTVAGSVLVAQHTGADEEERAGEFAGQTLSFIGMLSVVLGALGFLLGLGPRGLWIGMSLGSILGAVAAELWFRRGTWKESVVDRSPRVSPTET